MKAYPLIYGFRELVAGDGFVAGVEVNGRALLKQEDNGEWWLYGVEPGGIAEGGATEVEAYQNFRQSVREILCDSAALMSTFDAFQGDVLALAAQTNPAWDAEWQRARAAIRAGELQPEGDFAQGLPKHTKDVSAKTQVVLLTADVRKISHKDNCSGEELATAA